MRQFNVDTLKNGKIFNVTFIKKNGAIRRFNARLGVRKGVSGKGLSYNPADRNYLVVFSMDDDGFRTIDLSNVIRLKANGQVYYTTRHRELVGY